MSEKVLGNVQGDFEEFSKRFQEILKINLRNDRMLLSRVFRFMLKKKCNLLPPVFLTYVFVNFTEKESCTKFCGVLLRFHEIIVTKF